MEMGTGKTRTMLEIINYKAERNRIEHILWLCPCSCKINLKKDIEKHADINQCDLTICGIETLSSSVKTNYDLYNLVTSKKCILIVDESNLNRQILFTANDVGKDKTLVAKQRLLSINPDFEIKTITAKIGDKKLDDLNLGKVDFMNMLKEITFHLYLRWEWVTDLTQNVLLLQNLIKQRTIHLQRKSDILLSKKDWI